MRKLINIEANTNGAIVCDKPGCNFEIPATQIKGYNPENPIESIRPFINTPCPRCGENLLTEHDFLLADRFYKVANWLNKWFSWITIFIKEEKGVEKKVSFHKEIKID